MKRINTSVVAPSDPPCGHYPKVSYRYDDGHMLGLETRWLRSIEFMKSIRTQGQRSNRCWTGSERTVSPEIRPRIFFTSVTNWKAVASTLWRMWWETATGSISRNSLVRYRVLVIPANEARRTKRANASNLSSQTHCQNGQLLRGIVEDLHGVRNHMP